MKKFAQLSLLIFLVISISIFCVSVYSAEPTTSPPVTGDTTTTSYDVEGYSWGGEPTAEHFITDTPTDIKVFKAALKKLEAKSDQYKLYLASKDEKASFYPESDVFSKERKDRALEYLKKITDALDKENKDILFKLYGKDGAKTQTYLDEKIGASSSDIKLSNKGTVIIDGVEIPLDKKGLSVESKKVLQGVYNIKTHDFERDDKGIINTQEFPSLEIKFDKGVTAEISIDSKKYDLNSINGKSIFSISSQITEGSDKLRFLGASPGETVSADGSSEPGNGQLIIHPKDDDGAISEITTGRTGPLKVPAQFVLSESGQILAAKGSDIAVKLKQDNRFEKQSTSTIYIGYKKDAKGNIIPSDSGGEFHATYNPNPPTQTSRKGELQKLSLINSGFDLGSRYADASNQNNPPKGTSYQTISYLADRASLIFAEPTKDGQKTYGSRVGEVGKIWYKGNFDGIEVDTSTNTLKIDDGKGPQERIVRQSSTSGDSSRNPSGIIVYFGNSYDKDGKLTTTDGKLPVDIKDEKITSKKFDEIYSKILDTGDGGGYNYYEKTGKSELAELFNYNDPKDNNGFDDDKARVVFKTGKGFADEITIDRQQTKGLNPSTQTTTYVFKTGERVKSVFNNKDIFDGHSTRNTYVYTEFKPPTKLDGKERNLWSGVIFGSDINYENTYIYDSEYGTLMPTLGKTPSSKAYSVTLTDAKEVSGTYYIRPIGDTDRIERWLLDDVYTIKTTQIERVGDKDPDMAFTLWGKAIGDHSTQKDNEKPQSVEMTALKKANVKKYNEDLQKKWNANAAKSSTSGSSYGSIIQHGEDYYITTDKESLKLTKEEADFYKQFGYYPMQETGVSTDGKGAVGIKHAPKATAPPTTPPVSNVPVKEYVNLLNAESPSEVVKKMRAGMLAQVRREYPSASIKGNIRVSGDGRNIVAEFTHEGGVVSKLYTRDELNSFSNPSNS